jgi:glyoxylase-like metal-dependent hydrolase (beta-lactamase superfamily II)
MSGDPLSPALERSVPASPAAALPVVTFASGVTLHLNGHSIRARHVEPAHTDGDSIIHIPDANLIHTGDLYFAGMYPYVDLSSGGRIDGVIEAANRVIALSDASTMIVPGHGPLSNRKELEAWREMLDIVRRDVTALISAGQTADEIVAARPTADWDDRYGGGFMTPERFVRLVDASVRAGR